MFKRYALIFLITVAALAAGNDKVQTYVSFLIEVVKSIPESEDAP